MKLAGVDVTQIHITYSMERSCEICRFGEAKHVIYDQYMGQTLNNLNRHFLIFKKPDATAQYVCRIVAEFLSAYDLLLPEAVYCADMYLKGDSIPGTYDFLDRKDDPNNLISGFLAEKLRAEYTVEQERYILAHELFHEVFRTKDDFFASLDFGIEDYCETKADYFEHLSKDRESHIDRLRRAPPESVSARIHGSLDEYAEQVRHLDYSAITQVYRKSEKLREELFCDHWAALWLTMTRLNYWLAGGRSRLEAAVAEEDFATKLTAVYVGHYHLRMINLLRDGTRQYYRIVKGLHPRSDLERQFKDSEFETHMLITQIRSQYLLDHCSRLYAAFRMIERINASSRRSRWLRFWRRTERPRIAKVGMADLSSALITIGISLLGDSENAYRADYTSFRLRLIEKQRQYYEIIADDLVPTAFHWLFGAELETDARQVVEKKGGSLESVRSKLDDGNTVRGTRKYVEFLLGLGDESDQRMGDVRSLMERMADAMKAKKAHKVG
jgi:hypothetical protein